MPSTRWSGRSGRRRRHLLAGETVKVRLWGTRGSLAAAGPETIRYGGNTACVEVRAGDEHLVVLDAGTGIRRLGKAVGTDVRRIDILLTHLHMDHVQGLGFFEPLFRDEGEIHLWGPPSLTQPLRDRLTRYLSPPLFPVALRDLPRHITLHEASVSEPIEMGSFIVEAALIIHPGPTVGYRLAHDRSVLAYLPDHEPALGASRFPDFPDWVSGLALAADADAVIHDTQYTDGEYAWRVGWGHSTLGHALAFATTANAKRLVTFHHDPGHDDGMLDEMLGDTRARQAIELIGGREGLEFELMSSSRRPAPGQDDSAVASTGTTPRAANRAGS
jgi:phosphoribosyl 1,2-cyclic phosphodiesterase